MAAQDPKPIIRSMPKAAPAQVVAAAKKAGVTVTEGYVVRLRIIDKARAASSSARNNMPKPNHKKSKPPTAGASPKREAILRIGIEKPVREILAAARASGLSISDTYVKRIQRQLSGGGATATNAKSKVAGTKSGAKKSPAPKASAPVAKRGPGRPKKVSAPAMAPTFAPVRGGEHEAMRAPATAGGIDFARSVVEDVVARILAGWNG